MLSHIDKQLIQGVRAGEIRALAKAITLLESSRSDDRQRGTLLLDELLPHTGRSLRLGISGIPGAGKSSLIESLGLMLVERGHRVAVLAVDPSSALSGGSILGDKTRMERLAASERAFIRPSPSSGALGGVAERTREAILLCEAANYDVVVVETVGIGQSEAAVASMTDLFVLLQLPHTGDDLQAMKKGAIELADLIVIHKCDLDPAAAARAESQINGALRTLRAAGNPLTGSRVERTRVLCASSLTGLGIDSLWTHIEHAHAADRDSGRLDRKRREQAVAWMWEILSASMLDELRKHPAVCAALSATLEEITASQLSPGSAARRLLNLFRGN